MSEREILMFIETLSLFSVRIPSAGGGFIAFAVAFGVWQLTGAFHLGVLFVFIWVEVYI